MASLSKLRLPLLPRFSCIDIETDIEDWLEQVRENCMFGQVDQSHGVASGFLGGEPKSQWLARKRELGGASGTAFAYAFA